MSLVHTASRPLPKARRSSVAEKLASVDGVDVCEISITYDNDENLPNSVEMPLSNEKFSQLQVGDEKIKNLRVRVNNGKYSDFYKIENNIFYRMVVENNHKFDATVLPAELVNTALFLGHNQSGHNGFQRTYVAIKRVYYWKGMHKDILKYCKGCSQCTKTLGGEEKVHRTNLQTWCTTNGIYFHGSVW